jgi:hypothetical protein
MCLYFFANCRNYIYNLLPLRKLYLSYPRLFYVNESLRWLVQYACPLRKQIESDEDEKKFWKLTVKTTIEGAAEVQPKCHDEKKWYSNFCAPPTENDDNGDEDAISARERNDDLEWGVKSNFDPTAPSQTPPSSPKKDAISPLGSDTVAQYTDKM